MVYDFDGLAHSTPDDEGESVWTIRGSEVEIELEDRPALIRGRTRSDGISGRERRPRSLSASGRKIASAVAKLVVKSKNNEKVPERDEQSILDFDENESTEIAIKSPSRFQRGRFRKEQKVIGGGDLMQHDKQGAENNTSRINQAPIFAGSEEKSERGSGASSVAHLIGRVLSPRRLPRKKINATLEMIDGSTKESPESPSSSQQQHRTQVAINIPPFVENVGDEESIPLALSPSKAAPRIVSPLKAFSQRTLGSLLRHPVSGKAEATGDSHVKATNSGPGVPTQISSPEKQPVGILRASSHRPVRRPSIENVSILHESNKAKERIGEKKSMLGGSEHGTRSSCLIESDDSLENYSRTVSSLVSPRRKMASRKLDSAEVLQRAKARRQSGTGTTSDTKRRASSRTRQYQTDSDTQDKPKRQFSEGSSNTSVSRLTTQTCSSSQNSERERSIRESSRGRPRKSLETRSDHVSSTRRRASSTLPMTSSEARSKPKRRFSESSGNTETSKLTTRTCGSKLHSEGMQSRREGSRGRPRKSLETRSDHVSTTSRRASSRISRNSSEAPDKQNRRFSEGSGNTSTSRLSARTRDTTPHSERKLSNRATSRGSARKLQEINLNHAPTDDLKSERSRTPSKKKSSSENRETRSISNRSISISRTRPSLDDPKLCHDAHKEESSQRKSDRPKSEQRTRQNSVGFNAENADDLGSPLRDDKLVTEILFDTGYNDH